VSACPLVSEQVSLPLYPAVLEVFRVRSRGHPCPRFAFCSCFAFCTQHGLQVVLSFQSDLWWTCAAMTAEIRGTEFDTAGRAGPYNLRAHMLVSVKNYSQEHFVLDCRFAFCSYFAVCTQNSLQSGGTFDYFSSCHNPEYGLSCTSWPERTVTKSETRNLSIPGL